MTAVLLDPDTIVRDECNAREHDTAPDADLINSVKAVGVQDPVSVRPRPDGTYGAFKGWRRTQAAQIANATAEAEGHAKRQIKAYVRADLVGRDAWTQFLSLIENHQRQAMSPKDTLKAAELSLIGMDEVERTARAQTSSRGKSCAWCSPSSTTRPPAPSDGARARLELLYEIGNAMRAQGAATYERAGLLVNTSGITWSSSGLRYSATLHGTNPIADVQIQGPVRALERAVARRRARPAGRALRDPGAPRAPHGHVEQLEQKGLAFGTGPGPYGTSPNIEILGHAIAYVGEAAGFIPMEWHHNDDDEGLGYEFDPDGKG